jgi:hypothetical protein
MRKYQGTDALTAAKNQVLERMSGCGDEDCSACKNNNDAIDKLVEEAQKAPELQLKNAVRLVKKLDEHEGAESWSTGMRQEIDSFLLQEG